MLSGYIDAHVHLFPWRLQNAIYNWFLNEHWSLTYAGKQAEELLALPVACGAEHIVGCNYAHKPGIASSLNAWLLELARRWPQIVPLATLHPDDPALGIAAEHCLSQGFAGFKVHCAVQMVSPADPRLDPLYEVALAHDRPVLIHAGTAPHPSPVLGIDHFKKLVERYPRLKVHVAHLGMWEWEAFLALTEKYEGLFFDTAAIIDRHMGFPQDRLRSTIIAYQDRIMFGSDLPIMEGTYADFVRHFLALDLPGEVARKFFRDNALKLYGIR